MSVHFHRRGASGNIYYIMSQAYAEIGNDKGQEMIRRVTTEADSYDEALEIIAEYVELIDETED